MIAMTIAKMFLFENEHYSVDFNSIRKNCATGKIKDMSQTEILLLWEAAEN